MIQRVRRMAAHPAVKVGYVLFLIAATGFYLYRWGDQLPDLASQVRPAWVGGAFVLSCLSGLLYSYIQYAIYRRLGARPAYWAVFRIVTVSQLGKYLPGKVLFAGNYYLFSREAGIENFQIGANFVISMSLWILTASLCGLPVLSLLEPGFRYVVLLLPFLLALFIHPRFLQWLLKVAHWAASRARGSSATGSTASSLQAIPLAGLGVFFYLRVALLYLATWALAGAGAYFCLAALVPVGLETYPLALASIALGTVGGFLALFAPVGLGVREGIGALVLMPAVGADAALLGMVLLRGITVAVDLLLALWAMLMHSRRSRRI
jgi:hypothetical protein